MLIVWGKGDKRGGRLWGIGWQNRVKVEVIWWIHWSSTKYHPYLTSAHPREQGKDWNLFCMHPGCLVVLSAPWSARVLGPFGGVIDWDLVNHFIYFGIFCNFNIIPNLVVGPTCCTKFTRANLTLQLQPTIQDASADRIRFWDMCIFHETAIFWKTLPYDVALLKSAKRTYKQPLWIVFFLLNTRT